MDGLEFYTIEDELWCKTPDGKNFIVDESKTEIISNILDRMRSCYPESYKALSEIYERSASNASYYRYLMARRFCKCNFCKLDTTSVDVENIRTNTKFNFEKVECPMRGECPYEGIVCMPKFNSNLSPAEMRVMEQLYNGLSEHDTAKALFISPNTVHQHIKNVYAKLGIHRLSDFITYANNHNMFN